MDRKTFFYQESVFCFYLSNQHEDESLKTIIKLALRDQE